MTMHYNSAKANDAAQKDLRKSLRNNMTPAEALLWRSLRGHDAGGWKWRRQQGIGPFVLDFYCPALRLCVELDGSVHDNTYEYDCQRTAYLNTQGIRVVRFTNEQVFTCYNGVVAEIVKVCGEMAVGLQTPPPTPPLKGRGEPRKTSP
jgi:very-short-patch-repair endonuclease